MNPAVTAVGLAGRLVPQRLVQKIYESPDRARRAIHWLERAAAKTIGPQTVKIATGPLAGLSFIADLHRQKYFWFGTFEPWVQRALVERCKRGTYLWDVGAFTGFHTLLMRKLAGAGRVVAIEPDPDSRLLLQEILRLNGFSDVAVVDRPIAESVRRTRLDRVPNGPSQTKAIAADDGDLQSTTLDELLGKYPAPAMVKMDIEGGEDLALQGAETLLNKVRPTFILETHGEQGVAALDRLKHADYAISKLDRWTPEAAELVGGGAEQVLAVPN